MLSNSGIVNITMDDWFDYDGALHYLEENISWMKSASIIKVTEIEVAKFTPNDFQGVK